MHRVALVLLSAAMAAVIVAGAAQSGTGDAPGYDNSQALAANGFKMAGNGFVQAQQISPALVPVTTKAAVVSKIVTMGKNPLRVKHVMYNICYGTTDLWSEWGNYPLQQRITEYRTWCTNCKGCAQTYRHSEVHPSSTLCSWSNPWSKLISGGNGYNYSVVRSGAHFSCPSLSIPFLNYNFDRWTDWSCNTWGNCSHVRRS